MGSLCGRPTPRDLLQKAAQATSYVLSLSFKFMAMLAHLACLAARREAAELEEAGADHTVIGATAAGLSLGSGILERMGGSVSELQAMERSIEQAMEMK